MVYNGIYGLSLTSVQITIFGMLTSSVASVASTSPYLLEPQTIMRNVISL